MATRTPCKLLVLDDNEDTASSILDLLEMHGLEVATASTTEEADAILAGGFEPDAILLDLLLSRGESGYSYAQRLASDPRRRAIRIIAMSGHAGALGRFDLPGLKLMKPFTVRTLMSVVQQVCS